MIMANSWIIPEECEVTHIYQNDGAGSPVAGISNEATCVDNFCHFMVSDVETARSVTMWIQFCLDEACTEKFEEQVEFTV